MHCYAAEHSVLEEHSDVDQHTPHAIPRNFHSKCWPPRELHRSALDYSDRVVSKCQTAYKSAPVYMSAPIQKSAPVPKFITNTTNLSLKIAKNRLEGNFVSNEVVVS